MNVRAAAEMGLPYSDFLKMDVRQFNNYLEGYVDRRERMLNDNVALIKTEASNIAAAVWGNKQFNKPIKPFKLRGESRAAKLARSLNALGVTKEGLDAFMRRKEQKENGKQSK